MDIAKVAKELSEASGSSVAIWHSVQVFPNSNNVHCNFHVNVVDLFSEYGDDLEKVMKAARARLVGGAK